MIRLTGAGIDTGWRDTVPRSRRTINVNEGGAELASARWPDGTEWKASLGTAELRLTTPKGIPLAAARVQLDSTDYAGVTDSSGRLILTELLPGPYTISVYDSALAVVDTMLPASVGFSAARDSISRVVAQVVSLEDFVGAECKKQDAFDARSAFLVARVVDTDGVSIVGARWRLEPITGQPDPNAAQGYYAHGETGREGMVHVCVRLTRGKRVLLRVWRPGKAEVGEETVATALLSERVTTMKVVFRP